MLDHNGPGHFGSSFALGFSEPNFVEKIEGNNFRTNPEQAMASSATSATSFELIEDQALTAEEVEMASQEAQEVRTRKAAVAAGLVLDEPEAPPSASATDVMNDLSSALERLRVAFSTPTPGLGASGPAEDEDKEMSDAVTTERATPPTTRLKGFAAPINKPVSLVPVDGRPGYFKLVDLPDLFPVLPASAATLLRDVTVEEAVSLFHKFVGKNLTEDLVVRILEAYVPMKIQIRQEEVWASQFQRNKACIGKIQGQAARSVPEGKVSTPARHWLMQWAPFRRRRRRTSAPRTLNHTLQPLEVSAWPDDLRQALERGLFCPLELDDPEDIKEKYVPNIRRLRPGGVAGGDARSGDAGPPQGCHWPQGGIASVTQEFGHGGG